MKNYYKRGIKIFLSLMLVFITFFAITRNSTSVDAAVDPINSPLLSSRLDITDINGGSVAAGDRLEVEIYMTASASLSGERVFQFTLPIMFNPAVLSIDMGTLNMDHPDYAMQSMLGTFQEEVSSSTTLTTGYIDTINNVGGTEAPLAPADYVGHRIVALAYNVGNYVAGTVGSPITIGGGEVYVAKFEMEVNSSASAADLNDAYVMIAGFASSASGSTMLGSYFTYSTTSAATGAQPPLEARNSSMQQKYMLNGGGGPTPTDPDITFTTITANGNQVLGATTLTQNLPTSGTISVASGVAEGATIPIAINGLLDGNVTSITQASGGAPVALSGSSPWTTNALTTSNVFVMTIARTSGSGGPYTITFTVTATPAGPGQSSNTEVTIQENGAGSPAYNNVAVTNSTTLDLNSTEINATALIITAGSSGTITSVTGGSGITGTVTANPGNQYAFTFANAWSVAVLTIVVTAEDGTTTATFTLNVKAAQYSIALLSAFNVISSDTDAIIPAALNGTFQPALTTHVINVADTMATLTIDATRQHAGMTMQYSINGGTWTSMTDGTPTPLAMGSNNTFTIRVTAADGSTTKDYVFNLNRVSANIDVTGIEVFNGASNATIVPINTFTANSGGFDRVYQASALANTIPSINIIVHANGVFNIENLTGNSIPMSGLLTGQRTSSVPFTVLNAVVFEFDVVDPTYGVSISIRVEITRSAPSNDATALTATVHKGTGTTGPLLNSALNGTVAPGNTTPENVNVPYDNSNNTLTFTIATATGAIIEFSDDSGTNWTSMGTVPGSGQHVWTYTQPVASDIARTILIRITAADGVTINILDYLITLVAPSTDLGVSFDFGSDNPEFTNSNIQLNSSATLTTNPAGSPYALFVNGFSVIVNLTCPFATFRITQLNQTTFGGVQTSGLQNLVVTQGAWTGLQVDEYLVQVEAQNGATALYTIRVVRQPGDSNNTISSLTAADDPAGSVSGVTVNNVPSPAVSTITITVANGKTGASINDIVVNGHNLGSGPHTIEYLGTPITAGLILPITIGSNPHIITVIAEDGTQKIYEVFVREVQSNVGNITNIGIVGTAVAGFSFAQATTNYPSVTVTSATISFSISVQDATATWLENTAQVTPQNSVGSSPSTNVTLTLGSPRTFVFKAMAQDGTLGVDYTITITLVAGNSDASLASLQVNGTDVDRTFTPAANTYVHVLPRTTTSASVVATATVPSPGTTITYGVSNNLNVPLNTGVSNDVTITVTPETGAAITYTVKIYRAEQNSVMQNMDIQDASGVQLNCNNQALPLGFTAGTTSYNFQVRLLTNPQIQFIATPADSNAVVEVNPGTPLGSPINAVNQTYTFVVRSELAVLLAADGILTQYESHYTSANIVSVPYDITIDVVLPNTNASPNNIEVFDSVPVNQIGYIATQQLYNINNLPATDGQVFNIVVTLDSGQTVVIGDGLITVNLGSNPSHTHIITISPESGPNRNYTIVFNTGAPALSNDTSLNNPGVWLWYVDGVTPVLDTTPDTTITDTFKFNVPAGINVVDIRPQFTHPNATFVGNAGIQNLGAGTVFTFTFQVQAEDGTTGSTIYTVEITRATFDTDDTLSDLKHSIDGGTYITIPGFAPTTANYTISLTALQNDIALDYIANSLNATVTMEVNGTVFPNQTTFTLVAGQTIIVIIRVQAEDPSQPENIYTVIINKAADNSDAALDDLSILDENGNVLPGLTPAFDPDVEDYAITVPYAIDRIDLDAIIPAGSGYNIIGPVGMQGLLVGDNVFVIQVVDANGELGKTYTVTVTRLAPSDDAYILTLESALDTNTTFVPVPGFNQFVNVHEIFVPRSSNATTINFDETISPFATIQKQANYAITPGQINTIVLTVISESGIVNAYIIHVIYAEETYEIQDIRVLNALNSSPILDPISTLPFVQWNVAQQNYTVVLPAAISNVIIEVTLVNTANGLPWTTLINAGVHSIGGDVDIVVSTISELHRIAPTFQLVAGQFEKSLEYTISFEKTAAAQDVFLALLEVDILHSGSTANEINKPFDNTVFNPDHQTYIISGIADTATDYVVRAVAQDPANNTVTGGSAAPGLTFTFSISSAAGSNWITHHVTVECDLTGIQKVYTIILMQDVVAFDPTNEIQNIIVMGSDGIDYMVNFNEATLTYNITVDAVVDNYTIIVITASGFAVVNGLNNGNSGNYNIAPNTTNTHVTSVTAENGDQGPDYTINVTRPDVSTNSLLDEIYVDGALPTGFTPTNEGPYFFTRAYTVLQVNLNAVVQDPTATVAINNQVLPATGGINFNLVVGINVFAITVTAQDGSTRVYTVVVERLPQLPTLQDLFIEENPQLRDENGLAVSFDPETNEYYIVVPFEITEVTPNYLFDCNDTATHFGHTNLVVGNNVVKVVVTNPSGETNTYIVNVRRLPDVNQNTNFDSITIAQIEDFNNEVNNSQDLYPATGEYVVVNEIKDLDVTVILSDPDATYQIINDKNLRIGENLVYIVITASDEETTRIIEVKVIRTAMTVDVEEGDQDVTITEAEETEGRLNQQEYDIDLNGQSIDSINFPALIKTNTELSEVTMLTNPDNPNEVILLVTDGDDTITVRFNIINGEEPSRSGWGDLFGGDATTFLIGLLACLLMLMIIAGIANKDKFGKVIKKRQKQLNKEEKKAGYR